MRIAAQLVASHRPDGAKSAAKVTLSRPQLPSWGLPTCWQHIYAAFAHCRTAASSGAPARKLVPTSFAALQKLLLRRTWRHRDDGCLLAAPQTTQLPLALTPSSRRLATNPPHLRTLQIFSRARTYYIIYSPRIFHLHFLFSLPPRSGFRVAPWRSSFGFDGTARR